MARDGRPIASGESSERASVPGSDVVTTIDRQLQYGVQVSLAEAVRSNDAKGGTVIVLDDRTCPIGMLVNLEHFFAQESCGWCTPCRDGLPWTERILAAIERGEGRDEDLGILEMHTRFLGPGKTFCAHAPGAMAPLESGLVCFRDEFERHIRSRACPWSA